MNVVLLDRDGTLIVEPPDGCVDRLDKIEVYPDSVEALNFLAVNDFAVILVTNQAGIAEGRMTEEVFWQIHAAVLEQLAPSGIKILKTYMNGEASGPDNTEWRKPGPKMLQQAAADFDLDLSKIYMIGDRQSDVQAGINAGCKGGILVKNANIDVASPEAIYTAINMLDAALYVVSNTPNS